jgi:hypothetical protein
MAVRKFGEKTKHDYIRHIENFAKFLGHSPDTATAAPAGRRSAQRRGKRSVASLLSGNLPATRDPLEASRNLACRGGTPKVVALHFSDPQVS